MKLDADSLRAEADAHRSRMDSPLWRAPGAESDQDWAASLRPEQTEAHADERGEPATPSYEAVARPRSQAREASSNLGTQEILPRLEALDRTVERLAEAVYRRPVGSDVVPAWLVGAAGNPRTYDSPDASRAAVCVRVLPTTYAQLRHIQRRLGLRTMAGAWEYLLRLGVAAATRLPTLD